MAQFLSHFAHQKGEFFLLAVVQVVNDSFQAAPIKIKQSATSTKNEAEKTIFIQQEAAAESPTKITFIVRFT